MITVIVDYITDRIKTLRETEALTKPFNEIATIYMRGPGIEYKSEDCPVNYTPVVTTPVGDTTYRTVVGMWTVKTSTVTYILFSTESKNSDSVILRSVSSQTPDGQSSICPTMTTAHFINYTLERDFDLSLFPEKGIELRFEPVVHSYITDMFQATYRVLRKLGPVDIVLNKFCP